MSTVRPAAPAPAASPRALSIRLFLAMIATQEMLTVYLGVRLGLYDAMADGEARTPEDLAREVRLDPRYVREWVEQQAVAGFLRSQLPAAGSEPGASHRFTLPAEHREVLTVGDSPLSMVSLTALPLGGVAGALPELLDAFRTGAGVPDAAFGDDWRNGHSGANRALFETVLPQWLRRRMPDVARRLGEPGARVADLCCGAGWASLALAREFPHIVTVGYDIDAHVVSDAAANAAAAGLADRCTFAAVDLSQPMTDEPFDMVLVLDAVHELPDPVAVLRTARAMTSRDVLVLDARVAEQFTAPGDEIERFQYATSVLHCLPAGRPDRGHCATGTALRPQVMAQLAADAGFARCEQVPFDDRFHRAYRLSR